jgi:hypothetical protein
MPSLILSRFRTFSADSSPYRRILPQPSSWMFRRIVKVASEYCAPEAGEAPWLENAPRGLHIEYPRFHDMTGDEVDLKIK